MFEKIKRRLRKEQFFPSFIGIFSNPFYFARKGLFLNIGDLSHHIKGSILDVGCGSQPYRELFKVVEYIGLEIDTPENRKLKIADYFYDGNFFPFQDCYFDSLITNEVFEHVFNPENFLKEVNRVLKQNGILLMTVPFVWDEHEQPFDYARYSSFGIKAILEKNGFELLDQRKSINDIRVIFQLLNGYIYKKTLTSNKYLDLFRTIILISPFNILGEFLALILPKNDDLYLDNIILGKKIMNV